MADIDFTTEVCTCIRCGRPIYRNELFYNFDGEPWCCHCVAGSVSVVREGIFNGYNDYRVEPLKGGKE